MNKNKDITTTYFIGFFISLFFFVGVGVSHATLTFMPDETRLPLIGIGTKAGTDTDTTNIATGAGNDSDGIDSYTNVDWLLDGYYGTDINLFSIGKFEELKDENDEPFDPAELVALGFTAPWDPSWFTWDGDILEQTGGIGHIIIPSDSTFNWTGHFWYSIKAGDGFGLYDGGVITLTAGSSYTLDIKWDIETPPAGFTSSNLSHFSLWTDTQPIPEPATLLLFGAGLAGLAGSRLRKNKK